MTSKPQNLFTFLFGITLILTFGSGTALAEFDRNDPDDVMLLNLEIFVDPLGMGYIVINGDIAFSRLLLNEGENNVGGEVGLLELTPEVVLEAMSFKDYSRATLDGRAYIDLVVGRASSCRISPPKILPGISCDLDPYREKLLEALPKNRETVFPLRRLSRAEVLFGQGTFIGQNDYTDAVNLCGHEVPCQ